MLRRRLVMNSSSDEDDNQPPSRIPFDIPDSASSLMNANPNHFSNPPIVNSSDQPLPISDGEDDNFFDVAEDIPPPRLESSGDCPVSEFLLRLGLKLRRDWLDLCLRGLEQSVGGFSGLGVGERAKICFEKFLVSDMNLSGGGVLPENLDELHLVDLPGPFVLQIDEIVNISCALKSRYQKSQPGVKRCLKLSMTDGIRRVFGMEYRPIKALDALAPAGLKVVICNVHIRHGLFMLVPEAFEALGGLVEELEGARQRLVDEVNKPPRGIRTRNLSVPTLRDRATFAAWTPNGDRASRNTNDTEPEYTTPFQVRPQGTSRVVPGNVTDRDVDEEFPDVVSEESAVRNPPSNAVCTNGEEVPIDRNGETINAAAEPPNDPMAVEDEDALMYTIPDSTSNAVPNSLSDMASVVEETDTIVACSSTKNPVLDSSLNNVPNDEEVTNLTTSPSPYNVPNDEELLEARHPLILSGVRESPFTYLYSLSAKWTATKAHTDSVQGIVKCFLTGVKEFLFRDQPKYQLQAYIDDGSLISEITIHHDLVQELVGCPPQVASETMLSSDSKRAGSMKEILKKFQSFLVTFEGTMLIEMNKSHPFPIALEMNQGCTSSDARLLLRRVKSAVQARSQPSVPIDPINLSP